MTIIIGPVIVYIFSFDERGRFLRLIATMRQIGVTHGFGVDVDTGLYIEDDTATVYGTWGVWIIDTTTVTVPEDEKYFSAENIRVNYLTEGDSYNITSGVVQSIKPSIVERETFTTVNNNIFGLDQGLRTMKSLISSISTVSEGYSQEEDPTCMIVFEKDEITEGYLSDNLYTIQNLLLHVRTKSTSETTAQSSSETTSQSSSETTTQNANSATRFICNIGTILALLLVVKLVL